MLMRQTLMIVIAVMISLAATESAKAVTTSCVVLDVTILQDRVHVLCAEPPVKSRGGYPVDTGNRIQYYALPMDNSEYTNRFIQIANIALISGHTMFFSYTSGDYSGEAYSCSRDNCRKPWSFGLEQIPSTP